MNTDFFTFFHPILSFFNSFSFSFASFSLIFLRNIVCSSLFIHFSVGDYFFSSISCSSPFLPSIQQLIFRFILWLIRKYILSPIKCVCAYSNTNVYALHTWLCLCLVSSFTAEKKKRKINLIFYLICITFITLRHEKATK